MNTSWNAMEGVGAVDMEIPVQVGGTVRWVQGLSRLTTCDDIIYALLCNVGNPDDLDVRNYGLYETWNSEERKLSGRTKILKVWSAWGVESANVKLTMKKIFAPQANTGNGMVGRSKRPQHFTKRSPAKNVPQAYGQPTRASEQQDEEYYYKDWHGPTANTTDLLRQDIQSSQTHYQPQSWQQSLAIQELLNLVVQQETNIRMLSRRLKELDVQVEHYETETHMMRVQTEGKNYVQDAYLRGCPGERTRTDLANATATEMEEYIDMCESLVDLESKLENEKGKVEDLSMQIQDETFLESSIDMSVLGCAAGEEDSLSEDQLEKELKGVFQALDSCHSCRVEQLSQIEIVNSTLREYDIQLEEKMKYLCALEKDLEDLDNRERQEDHTVNLEECHTRQFGDQIPRPVCSSTPHLQRTIVLDHDPLSLTIVPGGQYTHSGYPDLTGVDLSSKSQPASDTESTSDTGLSSMHSTASDDGYTVLETLV